MKVALAQLNPKIGDFEGNREKILSLIEKARKNSASLVVFPELCVCGYPSRDLLSFSQFIAAAEKTNETIIKATKGITVIFGSVERNTDERGKALFNTAFVAQDGKLLGRYHKQLLPDYDIFYESRFFEPGEMPGIFSIRGKKIGVTICEDLWDESGYLDRNYKQDILTPYREQKIDLMINLSSSPFNLGRPQDRMVVFGKAVSQLGCPLVLCNQVAASDDIIFDGGSFVLSKSAEPVITLPVFSEALEYFDIDKTTPLMAKWPESKSAWVFSALSFGVKDFFAKVGFKKALVGLSGGIDSSLVAAIAASALGAENVVGVLLPGPFTSGASNEDALLLAKSLGISTRSFSITRTFEEIRGEVASGFGGTLKSLTSENIQPRLRMTILMAFANETNALVLNTSNKSEITSGYSTLYGDTCGAISVIGDLTKHEVYELSHYVNRAGEIIPKRVFEKAPSAELKENQKDEDTLPPYAVLDELVRNLTERKSSLTKTSGNEAALYIQKFLSFYQASEYKRRQFPPILRVSRKSLGYGRDIPIAAKISFSNE